MISENIKPKFWKWAEGKVFGIRYPTKSLSANDIFKLMETGLVDKNSLRFGLKLTREAFALILEKIENENLALSSPLKYCTKEELRRIALRNEFKVCLGWGAYWQESYAYLKQTYLPIASCKHGYLYRIHSRNLRYGIYNEEMKGFIGIRTKFNRKYLFMEYHWDIYELTGTVKPLQELCKTGLDPSENNPKLFDYLIELPEPDISLEDFAE